MSECLPASISQNQVFELHHIFAARSIWPWLNPLLASYMPRRYTREWSPISVLTELDVNLVDSTNAITTKLLKNYTLRPLLRPATVDNSHSVELMRFAYRVRGTGRVFSVAIILL